MQSTPSSTPLTPPVLHKIAAGDQAAVKECISIYGNLIWGLSRRHTRTAADAEDVTQEIFLSIWTSAKFFNPSKGSEGAFIATIARRRLVDRHRRSKDHLLIDSEIDIGETLAWADPGLTPQVRTDAARIIAVIKDVRPEWRYILELGFINGMSQSEISAFMNIPLGTVKSNMRRGIAQVRELMKITPQRPAQTVTRALQPCLLTPTAAAMA